MDDPFPYMDDLYIYMDSPFAALDEEYYNNKPELKVDVWEKRLVKISRHLQASILHLCQFRQLLIIDMTAALTLNALMALS